MRRVPLVFRITCPYAALTPADEIFSTCSASAVAPHFTPLTDTSRIEGSDPQCCHTCRRPENLCWELPDQSAVFLNGLLVKQRRAELIGNVVEGKGE